MKRTLICVAALLTGSAAVAQDGFSSLFATATQSSLDYSVLSNMRMSEKMRQKRMGSQAGVPASRAYANPGLVSGLAPLPANATASALASTRYEVDRAVSQQARDAFVQRLSKSDPAAGKEMAAQMRQHDFGRVYSGIVSDFGLRRGDVADAMTAYTLLGWMVATGGGNPSPQAVRAARTQIATLIAADAQFAQPAARAALGEELEILFVTLHASWQSAQRQGAARQFGDQVAGVMKRQIGEDLRQFQLTDRGLEKRG